MTHTHHWVALWYRASCPVCRVRRLRYGSRLEPRGYEQEIEKIMRGKEFNSFQKKWILEQVGIKKP